ncbi:AhpD-like protein [Dichotomopilus funicola]|uniref:AhpD-like protein n=1 Tax=Dichotomopilus funicola TaxID=1934379 RepID=A0AAN6ZK73_9PEZI|nr:AhpD-like protein [Dichotomopilus funicola]
MASWNSQETTNEHLLPYLDAETAPPEVKAGMRALPVERNIFKILGHSTVNFPPFMKLLTSQWHANRTLRSSDWQTAVLRTAAILDAPYEWEVNEPVARIFDFSDEQLAALKNPHMELPEALFSLRRRLIARAIEELSGAENRITPETLERVKGVLNTEEILELLYMHGVYSFLARVMKTVNIDSDGPIPGLEGSLRKYNATAIEKERRCKD